MEDNKIRVVAAVVDTTQLTLYKDDGETIVIPQGDKRLRAVLGIVTPQLVANQQGDGTTWADVEIPVLQEANDFLEFESTSNGAVKLFRIAKEKLKALFALGLAEEVTDTVEPTTVGSVPVSAKVAHTQEVVDEILAHAVPVSSPNYNEDNVAKQSNIVEENDLTPNAHPDLDKHSDTVIAVVDGKVIPGVELIKTQFARAAKMGSTVGVENFLKRLGAVINERSHSVQDLLKFMERGDLPIADDGSIIIYKILRRDGKAYVDCHTRQVKQWIGAYVHMDARLVDHDRRNECSNGLHVARRGYISQFSGDVCVLAKLAPEDVIAVPNYDANKMRVCGYHIIHELTDPQYKLLMRNRPISDDEDGKIVLANAIAGNHIGRTHNVKITEQRGGGVQVSTVLESKEVREQVPVKPVEALDNPDKENKDSHLDVKALSQEVGQMSRSEKAKKLYDAFLDNEEGALEALKAFKKAAKVSWDKLGIPDPESVPAPSKPVKKAKPKDNSKVVAEIELSEGSARERIAKLMQLELNQTVAKSILTIKRQSKKSWEVLGVDNAQASLIVQTAG